MNEDTLNKIREWLDTKPMYWGVEPPDTCSINDVEFIEYLETLVIKNQSTLNK